MQREADDERRRTPRQDVRRREDNAAPRRGVRCSAIHVALVIAFASIVLTRLAVFLAPYINAV